MNHIYRLKRTGRTQQVQPVPETARSASKGLRTGKTLAQTVSTTVASVALAGVASLAHAQQAPPAPAPAATQLPQGGVVTRGSANINTNVTPAGTALMSVNQTSARAVIDWASFNVGSQAKVQFNQPGASAVALNNILGNNASQIYGQISANGQVFLSNPNGIYFSPTAQVDVGGLVATTGKANADDFMAGKASFNRDGSTGSVVNQGQLKAALGGYIALLAPEVRNQGVVIAQAGTVALATGEAITLSFNTSGTGLAGLVTTPQAIAALVDNQSAVLAEGGQIILSAHALASLQGAVVNNSGQLSASSLTEKGGKIVLMADKIALTGTSRIDANGATGGGTVLVGGDWQGTGDTRQATQVTMAQGASIEANATQQGNGGKVVLWSDVKNANSLTQVDGRIEAKGAGSGSGGQVETSGHTLKVGDQVTVQTQATGTGQSGQWLLDPADITISDGTNSGYTNTSGSFAPDSGVAISVVNASTLQTALSSNVTITTTNTSSAGAGTGNITIAANLAWSAATKLTLNAAGGIGGWGNLAMPNLSGSGIVFNQAGNSTYWGVISGINASSSVTKQGSGTLMLAGANTYVGYAVVSAGVLKAGNANAFGSGSASISITSGAAVDLNGQAMANTGGVTLNGTGIANGGALFNSSSTAATYQGGVYLGSASSIVADAGAINLNFTAPTSPIFDLTLGGATGGSYTPNFSTGTGALIKQGAGTWSMASASASSYSGGTRVEAGILQLTGSGASFGTGTIAISAGAVLATNRTTGGTLSNAITGSGTATIANLYTTGASSMTLSGTLTGFTGTYSAFVNEAGSTVSAINLPSNPDLAGKTIAVRTNYYTSSAFSVSPITWTGTATGTPTLQLNGTTVNSSVADVGGKLTFSASALTVSQGYAWSLTNNGSTNYYLATDTATAGAALVGTAVITAAPGVTTLSQTGVLSGSGNLSIVGSTALGADPMVFTLSGNNTYTGNTTISGGTLKLGHVSALGSSTSGTVTVNAGAQLDLNGKAVSVAKPLTLYGNGTSNNGALSNSSTAASYAGPVTLGSNASIYGAGSIALTDPGTLSGGAFNLTLGGAVGGTIAAGIATGALTKINAGTWTLNAVSSIAGGTTVNAGTLKAGVATNAFGVSANPVTLNGGTLDLAGFSQTVGEVSIMSSGGTIATTGASATLSGSSYTIGNANASGNLATIGAQLDGSSALVKVGPGAALLNATNSFSGGLVVNGGVLKAGASSAFGATTNTVYMDNSATLDLGAFAHTVGSVTVGPYGGMIAADAGVALTGSSYAIGNTAGNPVTINAGLAGSGALSKTGAGTALLTGANSYSGGTTIAASGGIVQAGSATALGTGAITVNSGGALDLAGQALSTTATLSLIGTGVNSGGALLNSAAAAASYAGLVSLTGATSIVGNVGTIALSNAGTITGGFGLTLGGLVGGSIASIIGTGAGSLTKQDTGTWTLSGVNTYTGGTTINAGTLSATVAGALPSGAAVTVNGGTLAMGAVSQTVGAFSIGANGGAVTANAGVVLTGSSFTIGNTGSNTVALGAVLDGASATLTMSGTGALNLDLANTYGGGTSITGGVVTLGNASALGTGSAVSVGSGVTLAYNVAATPTKTFSGTGTVSNLVYGSALDLSGANVTGFTGTYSVALNEGLAQPTVASIVLPASPAVGSNTFNVNTTGYQSAFTAVTPIGWSGTATGTSTTVLKINGSTVTSGAQAVGAKLTNSSTGLSAGASNMWSKTLNGTTTYFTTSTDSTGSTVGGTFNVPPGVSVTEGGPISGAGYTLTLNGGGTLTLSGSNTYTGATTINAGVLKAGSANALGPTTGAGAITVSSGAALDLNGQTLSSTGLLYLNGTGINSGGALMNSSTTGATYPGQLMLGATDPSIMGGAGSITLSYSGTLSSASGNLTLGGAAGGTIASAIGNSSSTISVTVQNASTWNLTAQNLFKGGLTINGGTVNASNEIGRGLLTLNGGTLNLNTGNTNMQPTGIIVGSEGGGVGGTGTGVFFFSNGSIIFNNSKPLTFSFGVQGNNLTVIQNGTGTTTLGGTNTNSLGIPGTAALNAGTLIATSNASLKETSFVTVNAGATLKLNTGLYTGTAVTGAGTLAAVTYNYVVDLTANNVSTFTGTYSAAVDETTAVSNITTARFILPNYPDLTGRTLNVATTGFQSSFTSQALYTWAGTAGTAATTALGLPKLTLNGTTVASGAMGLGGTLTYTPATSLSIGAGYAWTLAYGGTTYYLTGTDNTAFALTGNAVATVGTGMSVSESGVLSGVGASLTLTGGGTLTLTGNNSYSGGTNLNAGKLALGSANAVGSTGTISFGGGALQYTASNTADLSARFSTAAGQAYALDTNGQNVTLATSLSSSGGSLTKLGTGTLTVTGTNSYDGGTNVNGGTLAMGSASALGTTGTIAFGGGTLRLFDTTDYSARFSTAASQAVALDTNGQNVTLATNLSSSGGTLTKAGTGTLTLTGNNTYTGGTNVNGGTLALGSATALGSTGTIAFGGGTLRLFDSTDYSSRFSNAASQAVALDTNGQNVTLASVLSSSGGTLTKTGSGTLTVSGANTFTGAVNLNGGVLVPAASGALGVNGTISFGGGTLQYSAASLTDYSGRFSTAANQPYVIDTSNQSVTFASALTSAGGSLTKLGTGFLSLNNASNTFTGGVNINAGTLVLNNSGALGSTGTISFGGGTLQSTSLNTVDYSARFSTAASQAYALDTNGQNVTLASALSSSGGTLKKLGTGTLTLTHANTYDGGTTIAGGTLSISADNNLGTAPGSLATNINLNSGALQVAGQTSAVTLGATRGIVVTGSAGIYNNSSSYSLTLPAPISGTGSLTLAPASSSTATVLLTATNTFTGGLTVSSGVDLQLGNGGATGSLAAASVANNGAMTFNLNAPSTWAGFITGTGSVTVGGTGAVTFTSPSSTYSGGTTINSGSTLVISAGSGTNSTVLGYWMAPININGGTLIAAGQTTDVALNSSQAITVGAQGATFSNQSGSYAFRIPGTITSAGPVTLVGGNLLALGTVNTSSATGSTGTVTQTSGNLTATTITAGAAVALTGGTISVGNITAPAAVTLTGSDLTVGNVTVSTSGVPIVFKSSGNIVQSASSTVSSTGGDITYWADSDASGDGSISIGNSAQVVSNNGNIAMGGGAGTSALDGSARGSKGVFLQLGSSVQTGTGNITVQGVSNASLGYGVASYGTLTGRNVTITGSGWDSTTATSYGVSSNGNISADGALTITGTGGGTAVGSASTGGNYGVSLTGGTVEATGSGSLTINGTGGGKVNTGTNYGVYLSTAVVRTQTGALNINAVAGAGGAGTNLNAGFVANIGASTGTIIGGTNQTGSITVLADSWSMGSSLHPTYLGTIQTNGGAVTLAPLSASSSFNSAAGLDLSYLAITGSSSLTLGKPGNTGVVNLSTSSQVSKDYNVAGPVSIYGNITLDANLKSTGTGANGLVTLTGPVQQTSGILTAPQLLLAGAGSSNVVLGQSNVIGTVAGSGLGNVTINNGGPSSTAAASAMTVGTVGGTQGLSATGTVMLSTSKGDLTLANNIATTDTGTSAVTLIAGSNMAVGDISSGNLVVNTGVGVSTGTNGRVSLYTGATSNDAVTALVGSGSGNFRYGSTYTTTNFFTALGSSGTYAIYRERPTVAWTTASNQTLSYGVTPVTPLAGTVSGLVNGDVLDASLTVRVPSLYANQPLTSVNGSGFYNVGSYIFSRTEGARGLGYLVSNPTLTIGTATLTITPNNINKVYDGKAYSLSTASPSFSYSGLVGNETAGSVFSGTPGYSASSAANGAINAGSYAIVPTGNGYVSLRNNNYTLAYANGTLTVNQAPLTVTVVNDARFIGESDTAGYKGVLYTGFVNKETSVVLGGTLAINRVGGDTAAGIYTGVLQASGLASTNYSLKYVPGSYTIVPADQLLVSLNNTSATYASTPTYGVTSAKYYSSATRQVVDLTSRVVISGSGGLTLDDGVGGNTAFTIGALSPLLSAGGKLSVGAYQLGATSITNTSANYNNTITVTGGVQINPKDVTASVTSSVSKAYDGLTTMNGLTLAVAGAVAGDAVTASGSGAYATKNAGSGLSYTVGNITLLGADARNYVLTDSVSHLGSNTLTGNNGVITPVALSITANNASKTYDGTAWSGGNGVTYAGFVGADSATSLGGTLAYGGTSQGASNAGTYSIIPSGLSSTNYTIGYTNGSLVINPAGLTAITGTVVAPGGSPISKVYDGNTTATLTAANYAIVGWAVGEGATVTKTTGTYDNADAGTGKTVTVSLLPSDYAPTGSTLLSNYTLPTSVSGAVGVITPKPVTVTNTARSTTYDAVTTYGALASGMGFTTSALVGSDTVGSLTQTPLAVSASGVAQAGNFTVRPSNAVMGVGNSANYDFSYVDATHTLAKANLAVTASSLTATPSASGNVYNGTAYTGTYTTNALGNDASGITVTGLATGTNAGTYTSSLQVSGAALANYNAPVITEASLVVVPKPVTLTNTSRNTTYDGTSSYGTLAGSTAFTTTAMVGSDTVASATQMASGVGVTSSGVAQAGSFTVTPSAAVMGTGLASNYDFSYVASTHTVDKANLAIAATASLTGNVYNGTAYTGTYTTNALGNDASGITVTGLATGTNAGTYTSSLQASGAVLSNYNAPVVTDANLVISPKPVTVSNTSRNTTYDAVTSYGTLASGTAFTATLVGSDSVASVTQTASGTGVTASGVAQAGSFTVTPSAATMGTGLASNYSFSYVPSTHTVDKANLALTATASLTGNVYNGNAYTGTYTSNALGSDASGMTVTGMATGTNAGTYTSSLAVSGAALSNYNAPSITNANLVVSQRPVTVTADAKSRVYGDANPALTYTVAADGVGSSRGLVNSDSLSGSLSTTATGTSNVGSYTIDASALANGNYLITANNGSLTVTQRPVTVTADAKSRVYGDTNPALTYTVAADGVGSSRGLVNSDSLSGSLSTAATATSSVGSYTIDASALANSNYLITTNNGNLTVTQRPVTTAVTINGALQGTVSKTYDGTTAATLNSANYLLTGWVGSDSATVIKTTGTYDSATVGSGKTVTVTLSNSDYSANSSTNLANYSLPTSITGAVGQISKANATVTANGGTLTYNGANQTVSGFTASGLVGGETTSVLTGVTASTTQKNAGSYVTTASGTDSNYNLTFVPGSMVINKAALTATGNSASVTYNGTAQSVSGFTVTGLQGADTVASLGSVVASGATGKNAGSYANTVTAGTEANYTVTAVNGALTIAKANATVTANGGTLTYNGGNQTVSGFTASGLVGSETASVLTGVTASTTQKNAGTYATLASGSDGNYNLTFVPGSMVINKAALTVQANNDAKFVTQADASGYAGVSYSGWVGGETATTAGLGGTLAVVRSASGPDGNTGASNALAGSYTGALTASGLTSGNYAISYLPGNYTIVPANQLLVRLAPTSGSYGGAATYSVAEAKYLNQNSNTIVDLMGNVSRSGNSFTVSDGAGGSASFTVSPVGAVTSGAGQLAAGGYQLGATGTQVVSNNFSNAMTLVGTQSVMATPVTAAPQVSKVYDGTTAIAQQSVPLSGALAGDAVGAAGSGAFASKNAGSNLGYTLNGVSLSGADAGNYYLSSSAVSGNNGSITPASLAVSFAAANKVYDGSATVSLTSTDNRFGSDVLTVLATGTFADKNVGTSKAVTVSGVSLSGPDAGNYSLGSTGSGLTASIARLSQVTWVGGATGNWFDPANWAGGALPDLANVASVTIPAGVTVSFDNTPVAPAQAGPVSIDSLGVAGSLSQSAGTLNVGAGGVTLNTLTQTGGVLTTPGAVALTSLNQTAGTLTAGSLTVAMRNPMAIQLPVVLNPALSEGQDAYQVTVLKLPQNNEAGAVHIALRDGRGDTHIAWPAALQDWIKAAGSELSLLGTEEGVELSETRDAIRLSASPERRFPLQLAMQSGEQRVLVRIVKRP